MEQVLAWAKAAWPYAIVLAPGLWAAWRQLRRDLVGKGKERASLIQIAQEAAGQVIEDLRDEAARLRKRLDDVEAELNELRREHSKMMADKDAKITLLEGEKRMLEAEIEGLRSLCQRHNIPLPERSKPYWAVGPNGLEPIHPEIT